MSEDRPDHTGSVIVKSGTIVVEKGEITIAGGTVEISGTPTVKVDSGNITVTSGTVNISEFSPYINVRIMNPGSAFGLFRSALTTVGALATSRFMTAIVPPTADALTQSVEGNTPSTSYVTLSSDNYVLLPKITQVNGHAMVRIMLEMFRGTGTGLACARVTATLVKFSSTGTVTTLGTSRNIEFSTSSRKWTTVVAYLFPDVGETAIADTEKFGLRVLVEMKTTGTGKSYVRLWYASNIWKSYAYLPI